MSKLRRSSSSPPWCWKAAANATSSRHYEVSRQWVNDLVRRYTTEGAAAYVARSRRPHTNRRAVGAELEERIIELRKTLSKQGYDAGAQTIAEHLAPTPALPKCLR
jgi:uncharacterized membrane protein